VLRSTPASPNITCCPTKTCFLRVIRDALSGGLQPVMGAGNAMMASRGLTPTIQPEFQDVLVAHVDDGFPSGLAPDESAVALYVLPAGATPVVRIEFKDETGVCGLALTTRNPSGWTRRNRCG
jgi:hypothetical protein